MIRRYLSVVLVAILATAQLVIASPQSAGSRGAKPALTAAININTASATDLEKLPGIGAKTAGRIIEYRQKNGPFKKVEELMNVRGVGEKNFLKLRTQITVAGSKAEHPAGQPQ